ncbi:MAG: hypothetical protein K2K63_17910 [Acetatifactor sp.]|nr:hypothetical protein [Acetatifactor sp.]
MADIKSYMKEKKKRERNQADYKEKIMKHKLTNVYRFLLVAAAAIALIAVIIVQYRRHVYTDYDIVSSAPRERVSGSTDLRLGNAILTYSKDGAHCTDAKGNALWNQTYEFQDVRLAMCGSTVAIAEYNGRSIFVQNGEKQVSKFTTTMPIRDVSVSAEGYVTAVLEGTDVTVINTYSPGGEIIYEGEARMNNSGYPAAISLSPDGELLCVSYWYLDAGVVKTNVVFYNFGDVGENVSDCMVGIFFYTDTLVPQVQFMNNNTAFAVGDNRLAIYSGSYAPMEIAAFMLNEEIKSVFYSDKYIGLVFQSEDSERLYRMDVYDTNAAMVGSFYFDIEYTDIFFGQNNFVAYNEKECVIITMDGNEKFNGEFDRPVRLMLPVGNSYKYLLVTDSSIDTIQMK